jgi:hypothetical protein
MEKSEIQKLEIKLIRKPVGVEFSVRDTGCGMNEEVKKRLFEPGIITDYRIIINFNDIAKNRDYRIDQVLGNDSVKPKNNIEVSVRYGNRDFETFEYEIT